MAVFYGLYVENERLAAAFDVIRFFSEPNFFRRAHITVRGPYADDHLVDVDERLLNKRYEIFVVEPGGFFDGRQNTVFLKCDIPGIEGIWDKPDYGGQITPHLTFYDGRDRGFAYYLLDELRRHPWRFSCQSTCLTKIKTKLNPEELERFESHQNLYDEILNRKIDYRRVRVLPGRQRLVYIGYVLQFIHDHFPNNSAEIGLEMNSRRVDG
jgi:hypothetical protein